MNKSLGKCLKNEINALEKVARKKKTEIEKGKKEINERGKIVILEIRTRTQAEFEEL